MPVIKLISALTISILVAAYTAVSMPGPAHANTEPRCQVISQDNPEIDILPGQMVAVGSRVRVKCRLDQLPGEPTWTAKSELVGPLEWEIVDLDGTHDLVPFDLSENAVDLSPYLGSLVLSVEGVAPLKKATAPVWPNPTDGNPNGRYVTDTVPSEVRRLISFGHGSVFDGPHTERPVNHPLALSVQSRISQLDPQISSGPLGALATELLEEGRPWDAERFVFAMEATPLPTPRWIWILTGAAIAIAAVIAAVMIYVLLRKLANQVSKVFARTRVVPTEEFKPIHRGSGNFYPAPSVYPESVIPGTNLNK
jgi:hypothetical protein